MAVFDYYGSLQVRMSPRLIHYLKLGIISTGVIFASLGLGEAVYRFIFFDFDGATDRLPIELTFGIAFAWIATKLVRKIYQSRMEKIRVIRERNHKIRHAVNALAPIGHVANQQAIRVIREEVDRIDGAVSEMMTR